MARVNRRGPTFVCVGLPKTGSSWLYANLSLHPEVEMPPKKEINFLANEYYYTGEGPIRGLLSGSDFIDVQRRIYFSTRYQHYKKRPSSLWGQRSRLSWDIKYLIMPQTMGWYRSLFSRNKVSGDISPVYYLIPDEGVREISRHLPDLQIIIVLRNPIWRTWSHTRMRIVKEYKTPLENASSDLFYDSFKQEYEACSSYVELIHRWQEYFGRENVYVDYYDILRQSPMVHFRNICEFLAIRSDELPEKLLANLPESKNIGAKHDIPSQFAAALARDYKTCIEDLCAEYPDERYPREWLDECNEMIES